MEGDTTYRTDNDNAVLNVSFLSSGGIPNPAELERAIDSVPGVVDSGLFVGMADLVLVQTESGIKRMPAVPGETKPT